MPNVTQPCFSFTILAECGVSRARTGVMKLKHYDVETPVFMPVGTQGTMKGLLPEQLERLDCQIILGNTYHLGMRPGTELLEKAGGLHKFMNWKRALLTDSGGFQMVSLLKLARITEEGVKFQSPFGDGSESMLTPEESIRIQNVIGADIIMQLDDVVHSTLTGPRVEESVDRTSRWLDRCIAAHKRPHDQTLFPIVQGTINADLRLKSTKLHMSKNTKGIALGGLSGGEAKDIFWKMVSLSTEILPRDKPRYVMGVGFAVDIIICCALGADMFDCVFPTRTARFGCALVRSGQINLRLNKYKFDFTSIDPSCGCSTCKRYTKAFLYNIVTVETVACHLLSVHNIYFQMSLMKSIRESIKKREFSKFVKEYMADVYPNKDYPTWIVEALNAVNIKLNE